MDNICHTLVGAALAKAGLERRTPLAGATLMIGANFPDIDAIAVPLGMSFEWRRGITHGIAALVVLPVLLTGVMLAWDRFVRRRRTTDGTVADPRALLMLSAISILTHPVLDWMNVYGVRWLMPFDGRWFYGDTLFIVDPWIWAALALGVVAARRRWRSGDAERARRPAAWALAFVAAYIAGMFVLGRIGERAARSELAARGVRDVESLMVAPVPVNPFRRQVVASVDSGRRYHFGQLRWVPAAQFTLGDYVLASGMDTPLADRARASERGSGFLQWARFPFVMQEGRNTDVSIWLGDARYTLDAKVSWAAVKLNDAGMENRD